MDSLRLTRPVDSHRSLVSYYHTAPRDDIAFKVDIHSASTVRALLRLMPRIETGEKLRVSIAYSIHPLKVSRPRLVTNEGLCVRYQ
jgi:hypothetical protein